MKIDYPFIGRERKRPMVLVNIINPFKNIEQKFNCLLDTGADASVFNENIAIALGHNLTAHDVKQKVTFGVAGKKVTAYLHTFIIELLHPMDLSVIWSSENLEIKCIPNCKLPLLGTDDFLCNFTLTFDYENQLSTLYF